MKRFVFWLKLHWSLFPRVKLTTGQHRMAWCRAGQNPSPVDAVWRHWASMNYRNTWTIILDVTLSNNGIKYISHHDKMATISQTTLSSSFPWVMMTSSNGNISALLESADVSPHKGQWHGALMYSLIWAWTNGRANQRDAGHLRRHRAHCGVTVMWKVLYLYLNLTEVCS